MKYLKAFYTWIKYPFVLLHLAYKQVLDVTFPKQFRLRIKLVNQEDELKPDFEPLYVIQFSFERFSPNWQNVLEWREYEHHIHTSRWIRKTGSWEEMVEFGKTINSRKSLKAYIEKEMEKFNKTQEKIDKILPFEEKELETIKD